MEVCERNQEKSDVLVSARINLGVVVYEHFRKSLLRLVLCDDDFKGTSYPQKETLIVDFLQIKANMGIMSYGEAIVFAKTYLGYVPKAIKDL